MTEFNYITATLKLPFLHDLVDIHNVLINSDIIKAFMLYAYIMLDLPLQCVLQIFYTIYTMFELFCKPPHPHYFETVYCFICSRRSLAVARYQMICLVLLHVNAECLIQDRHRQNISRHAQLQAAASSRSDMLAVYHTNETSYR